MSHDRKYDAPEHACSCFVTPEHMWLSAASCGYGSGYEPGSQMEWNPDCLAHPGSEFTNLAFACNECGRDVPEDDAGPSCGAHILHIECGPWFGCDHCYLVRAEIP